MLPFYITEVFGSNGTVGMAIFPVISGNPVLWTFLMETFNLGIAKMSIIPENSVFPNPVLPKVPVFQNSCIALKSICVNFHKVKIDFCSRWRKRKVCVTATNVILYRPQATLRGQKSPFFVWHLLGRRYLLTYLPTIHFILSLLYEMRAESRGFLVGQEK